MHFLIFFTLCVITQQQKAIIFSSSIGFYNYRQTANALTIYHRLKNNGFQDQDIILMIAENSGSNQKNPLFGTVSFIDNQYENINTRIMIDYEYTSINLKSVFNIFRNNFDQNDLNKIKFSNIKKGESLFIYITGHGGNTYFKIRQRQAIIDQNFKVLFNDLKNMNLFGQIFLMSDSCSAITPFQTVDIQNFTAFGSSSFDQKSQSHGYDPLLNAPKSDDFTFYLNEFLDQLPSQESPILLKQLSNFMSFDRLKVHSKIVGKGSRKLKKLNQFLYKNQKVQTKKIKLTKILSKIRSINQDKKKPNNKIIKLTMNNE